MSSETSVVVQAVSKAYAIFATPADRLKQMVLPRLHRAVGLPARTYFREYWALRDVSFELRRGETIGILGRNGAGKSTLLQIVSGIMQPTSGVVLVNGRVSALLELGTGFNPEFTGRQNVLLGGQLKGISEAEIKRRFGEIAAFADIGEFIEYPVKTYSSGMLLRLAFALHAVLEPDILIVDEALAVGDVRFQAKCYDWLAKLKANGTSILFVSHDVGAVRRFCDRALWLEGGRTIDYGDVMRVTSAFTEFMLSGMLDQGSPAACGDAPSPSTGTTARPPVSVANKASSFADQYPFSERHQPLRRWGSFIGAIQSVEVSNASGLPVSEFVVGSEIEVHVVTDLPAAMPREGLSVGIGIRRVDGIDLIIRSTHDVIELRQWGPTVTAVHVTFKIANILAGGEYRLAVALEDRSGVVPSYYDFIEGALFFRSNSPRYRWGVVVPELDIQVVDVTATRPQIGVTSEADPSHR